MWDHGVVPTQIVEAISSQAFKIERNRADRAAPYILYGRDAQGRCIASPIVPTHDPRVGKSFPRGTASPPKLQDSTESAKRKGILMNTKPFLADINTDAEAVEAWIAKSDPDDWEPIEAIVSPHLTMTLQMTFDREQMRLLTEAARASDMPVIRWIKQLALEQAVRLAGEGSLTSLNPPRSRPGSL